LTPALEASAEYKKALIIYISPSIAHCSVMKSLYPANQGEDMTCGIKIILFSIDSGPVNA